MFSLDDRESADAGSDKNAGAFRQFRSDGESGLLHREVRRSHRVVDEGVHFLEVFLLEPSERIEILDLGGNPGRKLRRVEAGDVGNTTPAFAESFPRFFGSCTQRGNQTHAGYNNSSFFQCNLAYDFGRCASM